MEHAYCQATEQEQQLNNNNSFFSSCLAVQSLLTLNPEIICLDQLFEFGLFCFGWNSIISTVIFNDNHFSLHGQ